MSGKWTKSVEGIGASSPACAEGPQGPVARTEFPAKATHAQTRAHNASLVLRALYDLGPISRAEVARLTGLTRTSVGELIAELETEGLAEDIGRGPSTGGKAPTLVALDRRRAPRRDPGPRRADVHRGPPQPPRHDPAARRRATSTGADGDAALALVTDLIDEILAGEHQPILGIGVGTPGIVGEDGTIRWAVNLSWTDLPLGEILQSRYQLPTIVANDSRAAAIATYLFGGEDRPSNLVAIKVGRGIGAGLVLNGELFVGDGDGAGEIGHIVVEPDGAECHCGRLWLPRDRRQRAGDPAGGGGSRCADRRGPRDRRAPRDQRPDPLRPGRRCRAPATRPRWASSAPRAGRSGPRSRT